MTILRTTTAEFDWVVDVAIAGGGACGMTAALAASEAGADAIVLERDKTPFGSTGMSYGAICAAGSRLQRDAGVEDAAALLREDIMTAARGKTDARLANLLASHSGPTVDWLCDHAGIDLTLDTNWTGMGHRHARLHAPANRSGESLLAMLALAAENAGATILTGALVDALYADDEDRVRGVRVRRPDASTENLGCRALIVATCGFGANRDWVQRYIPGLADARYYGHEGNTGDGIAWGMALGAATADMGACQALGSLATPQSLVMPHTLMIGGGVQVNSEGRRFENELDNISGQALTILEQPGGVCWIVYDQRLHELALENYQEYRDGEALLTARRADNWTALATLTGMPAEAFEQTMADIAARAETGAKDEFGRTFSSPDRLNPPYFALKVTGALFHTQGGLVIGNDCRVVREDGSPLPNMFAGGGAARSVSGPAEGGYLPGMGLCTAVTLGRLAGQHAASLSTGSGQS